MLNILNFQQISNEVSVLHLDQNDISWEVFKDYFSWLKSEVHEIVSDCFINHPKGVECRGFSKCTTVMYCFPFFTKTSNRAKGTAKVRWTQIAFQVCKPWKQVSLAWDTISLNLVRQLWLCLHFQSKEILEVISLLSTRLGILLLSRFLCQGRSPKRNCLTLSQCIAVDTKPLTRR